MRPTSKERPPTGPGGSSRRGPATGGPALAAARDREFVNGLKRGFSVILAFDRAPGPLSPTEVSRRTGLTRAVARRYLLTLEELGYAVRAGHGFTLTPRVLQLGFAALSGISLAAIARPLMLRVVETLRESCSLSVLDGHDVLYLERVTADRIMTTRLQVGSRLPAHSTAMGRVLLAHLPPDRLKDYLATVTLTPLTEKTIRDKAVLRNDLREIRERGWASNNGEAEVGVSAVAVPIVDRNGAVVAALNSAAHASRVTMRELLSHHLPIVLKTASEISRALGARIPEPAS